MFSGMRTYINLSHLHHKSVQVVVPEPHSIAWEPLSFLINTSSPNLELCRGGNQFWCNTILKFVSALRWSTSPKGNQKSTIKCQRFQRSLQCLRLCCESLIECCFPALFSVKLFQKTYFPLHLKQKKDFKTFQRRKASYYYTIMIGSIYCRGCILHALTCCPKPS